MWIEVDTNNDGKFHYDASFVRIELSIQLLIPKSIFQLFSLSGVSYVYM